MSVFRLRQIPPLALGALVLSAGDPTSAQAGDQAVSESAVLAWTNYFPPPESKGGWRRLDAPQDIRRLAGMDPAKLDDLRRWLLQSDSRPFAAVVIRHGFVVLEVERDHSSVTNTRNVKSCAKAICATVLAIASEESQQGRLPRRMKFDDAAFDFTPWAQPLSDPRKAQITVKQLLNHTSGITPEGYGIGNKQTWEYILGHGGDGRTAKLFFDPGTTLEYSTHALYHAALVCKNVTGMGYDQFAIERLLKPLGIERWWFEILKGDEQHGNHASHTAGLPAREMARIAYCMLRNGRWGERQVIPRWFVEQTAAPTHSVTGVTKKSFDRDARSWSHGWELPALEGGDKGKGIARDARYKPGSGGQLIAFVPSLDLVIARQTGSSGEWEYEEYLRRACALVLPESGAASAAAEKQACMTDRFDQFIIPAVEKAIRQPATEQGGEIAWGESYQLSALVEMLDATHDPKYAALAVKLSDWIAKSRDDRQNLRDEFRDKIVSAWSSTNYSKGARYAWAVHSGMIVAPMARFAAVVRNDLALKKRWGEDADRLLKMAEEAVAVHDDEFRAGPGADEGYIYCPYLKKHLPLNMQNALARAWLAIDDATKTPKHRERVTRLARFLKNRLRPMDDGSYVWAYWPPLNGAGDSFEDISHAAINVDFMVLCYEHSIVFTRDDLARLEKTLLQRVLVADDRISDTVGGGDKFNLYAASVLRWGRLGRHLPAVRARLLQVSRLPKFTRETSALTLGTAYLSLPSVCSGKPAS